MKSQYFKNLAKGLVIVSAALALVNCDDSTAAASDAISDAQQQYQQQQDPSDPSNPADPSQQVTDPTADPSQAVTDPTNPNVGDTTDPAADPSQQTTDPTVNPTTEPGSVPSTDPVVNPGTDPVDTTATNPAVSSSSEGGSDPAPASSSSEAVKPASSSSEQKVESSSSEAKDEGGIFLATDTDENKDYMEVNYIERTGDNGGAILAYPKRLSDTKKHAVVLWGPGGGTAPGAYSGIIKRLASHGFVVIATSESPDGTNRGKPALDWLENKNNTPGDPLYGKLDMTKVGASGHSMGGLQSEKMLINDKRVITAVLNNSGAFNHAELTNVPQGKTAAIVYGEGGMERPNAEGDYNNNNVRIPACLIKMTGGQGNECQNGECGWGHGSGPWGGMAATVAWMRWHLGGEDFRKADFVGSTGRYIDGAIVGQPGKWKGQCKNF